MTLKLDELKKYFAACHDVVHEYRRFETGEEVVFIYCETLCDEKFLNEYVFSEISRVMNMPSSMIRQGLKNHTS
ncbi:hypothetical protein ABDI30_19445 [Paenibacillus cisolokensis]|uniref:hypothetical protein n=1 Tax=Paenibacillus cisolokensis TaxID=1658519 RepID=UPI003D2A2466